MGALKNIIDAMNDGTTRVMGNIMTSHGDDVLKDPMGVLTGQYDNQLDKIDREHLLSDEQRKQSESDSKQVKQWDAMAKDNAEAVNRNADALDIPKETKAELAADAKSQHQFNKNAERDADYEQSMSGIKQVADLVGTAGQIVSGVAGAKYLFEGKGSKGGKSEGTSGAGQKAGAGENTVPQLADEPSTANRETLSNMTDEQKAGLQKYGGQSPADQAVEKAGSGQPATGSGSPKNRRNGMSY